MKKTFLDRIQLAPGSHIQSARLNAIFRDYFRIDLDEHVPDFELIQRDADNDQMFLDLKRKYTDWLAAQPIDASSTPRFYVDDNIIIYLLALYPATIMRDLPDGSADLYPICSIDEINRVLNIQNTEDALLLYRCSSIVHDTRIVRAFLPRIRQSKNWSLTGYFDDTAFHDYMEYLPAPQRERCMKITAGFAFSKDANGFCVKTEYGNLIIVSEMLKYFLYYMNLFCYGTSPEGDVLPEAYLIAVRIMLGNESLDFDIDPRGPVDDTLDASIKALVDRQIKFVIGHEYAHYLLNHLEPGAVRDSAILCALPGETTPFAGVFGYSFKEELNADRYCLTAMDCDDNERSLMINAAFQFFLCLELLRFTEEFIEPPVEWKRTHPKPLERLWHLRKCMKNKDGWTPKQLRNVIKVVEGYGRDIQENLLLTNIEQVEFNGSIYLRSHHKDNENGMLIDRIDF